jgi:hypothetical protein
MSLTDLFDFLLISFPVSGVRTWIFLPPLTSFVISFFASMGGLSGAFLLLPFQVSVLHYTAPSVSSTNFVFNIVAIPSGICRYLKEGRMAWPLAGIISIGTLPGVFVGYYIRIHYLPDPKNFKFFVGCVLVYTGIRMLYGITDFSQRGRREMKSIEDKFKEHVRLMKQERAPTGLPAEAVVRTVSVSLSKVVYEFWGERFSFSTSGMLALALAVGVIGGAYGIGGGAIIAPFCVAVFHLPVHTVAGASLFGTFLTSILGVLFYALVPLKTGVSAAPDMLLGFLFGIGGFAGIYLGAACQKFMPQKHIKLLLGLLLMYLSLTYIIQFFWQQR